MYLTILSNHVRFDAIKSEKNCKFFLKKQDPTFCTATSSTPALPLQSSLVSLSRNCTASSATSSITAAGKRVRSVEVTSFSLSLARSLSLSLSQPHHTTRRSSDTRPIPSPRGRDAPPLKPQPTLHVGPNRHGPARQPPPPARTHPPPPPDDGKRPANPSIRHATPPPTPTLGRAGPGRTEREASKRN